jgi:protein-tyrosine phosphatase
MSHIPLVLYEDNAKKKQNDGRLFLGGLVDAQDPCFLTSNNIQSVVTVDTWKPHSLKFNPYQLHLPVLDMGNENIAQYFRFAFRWLQDELRQGRNVLVHCQAGVSRSPSIVMAYLMQRNQMSSTQAYEYVQKYRPQIRPNAGFRRQLDIFFYELVFESVAPPLLTFLCLILNYSN